MLDGVPLHDMDDDELSGMRMTEGRCAQKQDFSDFCPTSRRFYLSGA